MQLSTEERRALGIIAALLVLAGGARWLERPRPLLEDVPALDLAELERESREAGGAPRGARSRGEAGAGAEAAAARGRAPAARLDPNTASAQELTRLPGVGEALAARIVAERERAPFTGVEDLRRVRGIGPAMLGRITPLVTLPAGGASRAGVTRAPVAGAVTGAGGVERMREPAVEQPGPVRLNSASAAELQRLRGVGPALAARLLARRDSAGRFRDWSDVDAVPGVGPALLERLKREAVLQQLP